MPPSVAKSKKRTILIKNAKCQSKLLTKNHFQVRGSRPVNKTVIASKRIRNIFKGHVDVQVQRWTNFFKQVLTAPNWYIH